MSYNQRSTWPSDITLSRHARTLDLIWGQANATMSHQALRASCRCAECTKLRRAGNVLTVPEDIELQRIEPVGEVGLQFFFSDGHHRGIFPWAYLHSLAFGEPCSAG